MAEPKRFLSFTIFELFAVVVALGALALGILFSVNPERKEIQARNLERSLDMQTYMDAIRYYKKDHPETYDKFLGKIPGVEKEIGECTECFDIGEYLIPNYLEELPADEYKDMDEQTGYYIQRDHAEGYVIIRAPHAEFGVDLVDKERI